MDNFPIFLDIKNKPILVVGGGEIALRKVFLLNKAAPKITVVAKSFNKDLIDLTISNKNIYLIKRTFKESDINQEIGRAHV